MEFMILLVLAIVVVIIALPFAALVKTSSLGARIERLESEIAELRQALSRALSGAPEPAPKPSPFQTSVYEPAETPTAAEPVVPPMPEVEVQPIELGATPDLVAPVAEIEAPPAEEAPEEPEPSSEVEHELDEEEEEPEPIAAPAMAASSTPWVAAPAPEPRPARKKLEWEMFMGGTVFNRLGAIAILMGIAFLMAYAFKHNVVSPWARISMGFVIGGAFLFFGARFHRRELLVFAQGLIGAGIAILYLSSYASFNLYHLVPQSVALGLMACTTLIAIMQAMKYDSLAVSLLGLAGGFLTPLLLSSDNSGGSSSATGLFIYLVLLDLGLLAVAIKKDNWAVMEILTLAGTYLTYFVWHGKYYTPDLLSVTVPFLIVFWALFYALDVFRVTRRTTAFSDIRMTVPILNSIAFYTGMYTDIQSRFPEWMGVTTFAIALAYFVTVLILMRRHADSLGLIPRYVLTAITLLVVGTYFQFQGFSRVAYWSLESVVLVWCGLHWRMRLVWIPAVCLFGAALFNMIILRETYAVDAVAGFMPIWNRRFLAYIALSASMAIAAALFRKSDEPAHRSISAWLNCIWCAILTGFIAVETSDYFRKLVMVGHLAYMRETYSLYQAMTMAGIWIIYSLPLVWAGFRKRINELAYSGVTVAILGLLFTGICGPLSVEDAHFKPLTSYRMIVFALAIVALFVHRYMSRAWRSDSEAVPRATGAWDLALSWIGFELLTLETLSVYYRIGINHAWHYGTSYEFARLATLALVWMVYALVLVRIGLAKRSKVSLYSGLAISAISVCFTAGSAVFYLQSAIPYPVANLRSLTFVAVIAGLFIQQFWLRKRSAEELWAEETMPVFDLVLTALGFQMLTCEVLAYFAGFGGGSVTWTYSIPLEFAKSLTLSIVWTLYSLPLLWQGLRRRYVMYTLVGIGSLALAVFYTAMPALDSATRDALRPVLNYRALAFITIIAAILAQKYLLWRQRENYSWIKTTVSIFDIAFPLVVFELLTIEVLTYFHMFDLKGHQWAFGIDRNLARTLALSVVWALYSLPLVWRGFGRRAGAFLIIGFGSMILGIVTLAEYAYTFEPPKSFALLTNPRAIAYAIAIVVMILQQRLLARHADGYASKESGRLILRIVTSLFIFELLTAETWDHFRKAIEVTGDQAIYAQTRQAALSVVWAIYSILLMGYGIWRRWPQIRVVALGLFYITIIKVFFFDLSHLETLYRIFSFIGLGLILMATSYLYLRFKSMIVDMPEAADESQ